MDSREPLCVFGERQAGEGTEYFARVAEADGESRWRWVRSGQAVEFLPSLRDVFERRLRERGSGEQDALVVDGDLLVFGSTPARTTVRVGSAGEVFPREPRSERPREIVKLSTQRGAVFKVAMEGTEEVREVPLEELYRTNRELALDFALSRTKTFANCTKQS